MKEPACTNCQSRRREVYRKGFCTKCYYWHRKSTRLQQDLDALPPTASPSGTAIVRYRLRVAKRILEEYAWREHQLNSNDVHPLAVEALVYAVAAECRSEVGFALHALFAAQTPQARKCFFMVLLAIVENTPSNYPRLHTLTPPRKGWPTDAWMEWQMDYNRR